MSRSVSDQSYLNDSSEFSIITLIHIKLTLNVCVALDEVDKK